MSTLTCVAIFEAAAGTENDVKAALTKLLTPTRQESGCISYNLHTDNATSTTFVFYETWHSEADFDQHLASDHVKQCLAQIESKLVSVDIKRMTKVEG